MTRPWIAILLLLVLSLPPAAFAAEPADPVRTILRDTPTPSVPAVKAEELTALRERLGELQGKLQAQSASLDGLAARLAQLTREMDGQRSGLGSRLDELKKQVDRQGTDLDGLGQKTDFSVKHVDLAVKNLQGLQDEIKEKRDSLSGITDLMAALKRDVDDNSSEIVDVKRELAGLDKEGTPAAGNWWTQASRWPYLPLTAAVLSVTAIFLAVRQ